MTELALAVEVIFLLLSVFTNLLVTTKKLSSWKKPLIGFIAKSISAELQILLLIM
jgi:hypothetical protein